MPFGRNGAPRFVVEDTAQFLELVAMQLERDGFLVTKAGSGDEAVELLHADHEIDVILTDVDMPGALQGVHVLKHPKAMNAQTPVILMSGYADVHRNSAADLRRADIFIEKPLKLSELSSQVSNCLAALNKRKLPRDEAPRAPAGTDRFVSLE